MIGVLVVVIVILLSVMRLRGRDDDDWADDSAWNDYEEIISTSTNYNSAPPTSPPSSQSQFSSKLFRRAMERRL